MAIQSNWFNDYSQFLKSDQWQRVRQRVFLYYGKRCYCCKTGYGAIQVHHLDYSRYRNPPMSHVVPMCAKCHNQLKGDAKISRLKGKNLLAYHMKNCSRKNRKNAG